LKKKREKKEKLAKNKKVLWITVVIHSAFGFGETVIFPHPLIICIITNYKGFFFKCF
jgi:hypothetical protein